MMKKSSARFDRKLNTLRKLIAVYAVPFLLLSACGKGGNTNLADNVREANNDRELQEKIFKGDCSRKPLEAVVSGIATLGETSIKSAREQYQFVGATVTHVTNLYTTKDCSGAESIVFDEVGEFKIDTEKKTADSGKYITLKMNTLTVKINNEDGAKIAQASKLCGAEDWGVQSEKEVTDAAARITCYRQPVPSVDENIYHVDGNLLVFGSKRGRSTERPTSLDMDTKYIAN
jgi:hypothetical protein